MTGRFPPVTPESLVEKYSLLKRFLDTDLPVLSLGVPLCVLMVK